VKYVPFPKSVPYSEHYSVSKTIFFKSYKKLFLIICEDKNNFYFVNICTHTRVFRIGTADGFLPATTWNAGFCFWMDVGIFYVNKKWISSLHNVDIIQNVDLKLLKTYVTALNVQSRTVCMFVKKKSFFKYINGEYIYGILNLYK
jgi:hypothetical protein